MAISERKKQPFKVLHRIALKKAREIHESPIEKLYSIDEFGDCYYAEGDTEEVQPTQTMIERGVIDVHNHPHYLKLPVTFSGEDVSTLLISPIKQETIVCGYGYYHWIKRGKCTTDPLIVKETIDRIGNCIADDIYNKAPLNMSRKAFMRWRDLHEKPILEEYHRQLSKYTKNIGLTYGRDKL